MSGASRDIAYLRVEHHGGESLLVAPIGATVRDVLLANGISPYSAIAERLNCGGRGLCATCGVRFIDSEPDDSEASDEAGEPDRSNERTSGEDERADGAPAPKHWHDSLAARFGYPRLSCQIEVEGDMHLRIPEKVMWGSRRTDGTDDGGG